MDGGGRIDGRGWEDRSKGLGGGRDWEGRKTQGILEDDTEEGREDRWKEDVDEEERKGDDDEKRPRYDFIL